MKTVSTRSSGGARDSAGIGYIIIPGGVDKNKFIDSCFRKGTISLLLENGGIIDNVLITKSALNEIVFPETFKTKGSLVVWINQPRKNQPIAIGCMSKVNEFVNFSKNKASLKRSTKNYISEVLVDAHRGVVFITSNSTVEGGGDIFIVSTNKNKSSKINIISSSEVNLTSPNFNVVNSNGFNIKIKNKEIDDEITEIKYEKAVGLSIIDEFGNSYYMNSDNIQFKPNKKFNIGVGNEPAMLSETFRKMFVDYTDTLSKFATECAKLQVGTAMGPSTIPTNTTNFSQIALDLNEIKDQFKDFQSGIHFTD